MALILRGHPEIRKRLEDEEVARFSKFAALSRDGGGRTVEEAPDPMRTAYQRDRDRIVHCKAFRRLKHKTQVFIAPLGDHYRTRLTHTMEVMQVARTVARALRLNEDLTEAIALGHDLGHTPFGHAGEDALAELLADGFRHNEQSVRVVELLEKEGRGLNLTEQVRDGILKHSKLRDSIAAEGWGIAHTLEGQVVKIADSLAYLNHDIDDALRAGVIQQDDLPREYVKAFGETTPQRINAMVTDIVDYNWAVALGEADTWQEAVGNGVAIAFSTEALGIIDATREFMFECVYTDSPAKQDVPKTRFILHALFEHFCTHPNKLPADLLANPRSEPIERLVADYIAGMTDRYALTLFDEIFLPKQWAVVS